MFRTSSRLSVPPFSSYTLKDIVESSETLVLQFSNVGNVFNIATTSISKCDVSSQRIASIKGSEQPLVDGAAGMAAGW